MKVSVNESEWVDAHEIRVAWEGVPGPGEKDVELRLTLTEEGFVEDVWALDDEGGLTDCLGTSSETAVEAVERLTGF